MRTFEDALDEQLAELRETLLRKRKAYGSINLIKFGETGIMVRAYDKIERLSNLVMQGQNPPEETVDDSWQDLAGYSVLARIFRNGELGLPNKEPGAYSWKATHNGKTYEGKAENGFEIGAVAVYTAEDAETIAERIREYVEERHPMLRDHASKRLVMVGDDGPEVVMLPLSETEWQQPDGVVEGTSIGFSKDALAIAEEVTPEKEVEFPEMGGPVGGNHAKDTAATTYHVPKAAGAPTPMPGSPAALANLYERAVHLVSSHWDGWTGGSLKKEYLITDMTLFFEEWGWIKEEAEAFFARVMATTDGDMEKAMRGVRWVYNFPHKYDHNDVGLAKTIGEQAVADLKEWLFHA